MVLSKVFLAENNYYIIDKIRYLTINKQNNRRCLKNMVAIRDNCELKETLVAVLKKEFKEKYRGWFWCYTHDGFIDVLKKAGIKCIYKIRFGKNSMNVRFLYKFWKNEDRNNCFDKNKCCVHNKPKEDGERKKAYICFCIV